MKRLVWIFLFLLAALGASAQSRGSYFFGNSLLRSKLNPAFAPKTEYASFPGVGSLSADLVSNVGLQHFIFPEGETNYLFLNDAVPAETFLSKLPSRDPYLRERVQSDLFGFGMKMGTDGYATLSLTLVEEGNSVVSGDLLRYIKSSRSVQKSVFEGGSVQLAGYAALAAGYSHDMSSLVKGLRAGARFKLLLPLAAGRFAVDQLGMQSSPEQLSANVQGSGVLSGIAYGSDKGFSLASPGVRGLGAAVDFGASYYMPMDGPWLLEGIEWSASVCDLGGLTYRSNISSLSLNHDFSFQGVGLNDGDIKHQFDRLAEEIKTFTKIDSAAGEAFSYGLSPSIHVGATAHLWQDKAHVGLLYYHTLGHSNLMLSGGVSPLTWLNLGVNWTFVGPAGRLGFYAEFIPRRYLGLFFSLERASLSSNSSHIPIRNFTENVSFGVNVLFGK